MKTAFMVSAAAAGIAFMAAGDVAANEELAKKHNCLACHAADKKVVGPSCKEVAARYAGDSGALVKLEKKIKSGGSGAWGAIPMPPSNVPDADLKVLVEWILSAK